MDVTLGFEMANAPGSVWLGTLRVIFINVSFCLPKQFTVSLRLPHIDLWVRAPGCVGNRRYKRGKRKAEGKGDFVV